MRHSPSQSLITLDDVNWGFVAVLLLGNCRTPTRYIYIYKRLPRFYRPKAIHARQFINLASRGIILILCSFTYKKNLLLDV